MPSVSFMKVESSLSSGVAVLRSSVSVQGKTAKEEDRSKSLRVLTEIS